MFDWDFDYQKMFQELVLFAGKNPWQFIYYVLLILSPFFAISAFLAWQLAKHIEAKEKEQKKRARRQENIAKARGRQKVD
jgi:hypothetical protein